MSDVNWSKYSNVEEIFADIKSVTIQGATNVALATFEGIKIYLRGYKEGGVSHEKLLADVDKTGNALAWARPNEPLAKNGMKFLMYQLHLWGGEKDVSTVKGKVVEFCDEYLKVIKDAKKVIIENASEVFERAKEFDNEVRGIMTHCHSSTAESVIIDYVKKNPDVPVVCTETRPLFQGRKTARNLVEAGVDTTLTVDSAAESMIMDKGVFPVDIIFLGADEITMQGDAVNKIGSWGVVLAAYTASDPIYIVTSILKVDVSTVYKPPRIEMREARELWEDAPKGLKLVNPSFEVIDRRFITGFITEVGVIKPDEVEKVIGEKYGWLF